MFRLRDIYRIKGRKMILLNGSYNLRTNELDGHWEEIASPRFTVVPISLEFEQTAGTPSEEQYITVTGYSLDGDIIITAPTNFEISLLESSADTWVDQITLSPDSDLGIDATKVYVRLNAASEGDYTGRVNIISENVEGQIVELVGVTLPIPYTTIKYGLLYNWYVLGGTGDSSIIPLEMESAGWKLPRRLVEYDTLYDYIFAYNSQFGRVAKSARTQIGVPPVGIPTDEHPRWNYNADAYGWDSFNLNFTPGGIRNLTTGTFSDLGVLGYFWLDSRATASAYASGASYILASLIIDSDSSNKKRGYAIRFCRVATESELELKDGTYCSHYVGNDGNRYRTVKVGSQVWLADNLAETKYRDGSTIPEVTDNSAWAALSTGALCAYENDWNNV